MSVLNDISVQDGAAVREIASGLWRGNARHFINTAKNWKAHRMDTVEYSIDPTDDKDGALMHANAYWVTEDGRVNWGTPTGSWKDYCTRVLENKRFWGDGNYLPSMARRTTEDYARDALLANYAFPFLMDKDKENPIIGTHFLPILAAIDSNKVIMGSAAVFDLLLLASHGSDTCLNSFSRAVDGMPEFRDFSDFSTVWSVGTSTNSYDLASAVNRSNECDTELMEESKRYLTLAGLANFCESQMNRARVGGQVWRKCKGIAAKIAQYEDRKTIEAAGGPIWNDTDPKDRVMRSFEDGTSVAVTKIEGATRFRCMSAGNITLIRMSGKFYLLTRQDLLSLKFTSMGHSMWKVYAATIKVEYAPTDIVRLVPPGEDDPFDSARALADSAKAIFEKLDPNAQFRKKQRVIDYNIVKAGLNDLWLWYMRIVATASRIQKQDFVGRYLNEVFSVYTASLGGDLMTATISDVIAEIVEEYGTMGFSATTDIEEILAIFNGLPASAIQDFGRVAKIVPAYDVNPMYSFIDRARKMQKPNPRGKAELVGEFGVKMEELTDAEVRDSEHRFRCGCRVLLAVGDIKQRVLEGLPEADKEAMKDDPFTMLVQKIRRMGREISSACTYSPGNDLDVPEELIEDARIQAHALITRGDMPTNEYAGAFIDVTNTMSYSLRGDPDLAILKATAIVSGNIAIAMSNISGPRRATPTRASDGRRPRAGGTMITDYLLDKFPKRDEALAYIGEYMPVASTSSKIETIKYPYKTRIITSMCAEGRRIQGEYEHNNGKVLVHVPGFMVGINPADRLKRTYAALRQDTAPGRIRLYGSLDLSSFSTGMHWDIQHWSNIEILSAYGMSDEYRDKLEACTKGTYMISAEVNQRLFMVNSIGANYEGLDGKRNTFLHCVLWYLARCEAAKEGINDPMRAFIYIDDGAFSIEVDEDDVQSVVTTIRESLIRVYTLYGLKLNISKTVVSTSYMQFLNELFLHGIHIGYGFRALCHTAAQSFPVAATISEELAVITGGIRGAGVAGGHALRLLIGFNYILWLYVAGVVGSKGSSLRTRDPLVLSLALYLPTIAGGYGLPNWTVLFSNLAGNRDIEKLSTVSNMARIAKMYYPSRVDGLKQYVKLEMCGNRITKPSMIPDRLTIAHPGTAKFGDLGRDMDIAIAARGMAVNPEAIELLDEYINDVVNENVGDVARGLVESMRKCPCKLPITFVDKALSTDANKAVVTLVKKVASSFLIRKVLKPRDIRKYDRLYRASGRRLVTRLTAAFN